MVEMHGLCGRMCSSCLFRQLLLSHSDWLIDVHSHQNTVAGLYLQQFCVRSKVIGLHHDMEAV